MRNPYTLLITAAGAGSRFSNNGLVKPKPLIRIQKRTLLEYTLESFDLKKDDALIIATQRKHRIPAQLEDILRQRWPQIILRWFELDQLQPGQLSTAKAVADHWLHRQDSEINLSNPVLIHNCDTGFQWNPNCLPLNTDASMPVFQAEGDHWSFGKPSPSDPLRAISIAEKKRISDLASIGLYGFKTLKQFHYLAERQLTIAKPMHGEYYIAPMLQTLIADGKQVSLPRVTGINLYGTPKELCNTFEISWHKLLEENA